MNALSANPLADENIRTRASFMLNASRAAFRICPQLAAYFGNQFLTAFEEGHAGIEILRQMCPYCGVPLVDGKSVSKVSVVKTAMPKKGSKNRVAKGRGSRKAVIDRVQILSKAFESSHKLKQRVIKMQADDQLFSKTIATGTKAQMETRANQRNSIRYECRLCNSQIVFGGASRTSLALAGLDRDPHKTVAKLASLSIDKESSEKKQPVEDLAKTVPEQKTAAKGNENKQQRTIDDTGSREAVKDKKLLDLAADRQAAKRKKHKSKLLAAVTENKKKAEAKKAAESSAFSLSDFLTNL
ncbi:hypothetical protein J3B02_001741 [Coemansia erecta]|uniref:Uncharacterized protein n=1 Tax=Coemansia asiatica TaxID=1052880 RepID=A0A9W7XFT8_9FUNG|nr:hypothetical protein LPJ64_005788 [Coemansia asiatica]KAJ2856193.1 hypothetical protein J3B02_001741 [Coemansia erecta]KAJ2882207.1 hypothetical protein FB639_002440 [Coemansia asiatica]